MTLVEDYFWRKVLGGAAEGPGVSAGRQHFCKPEVAYLPNARAHTQHASLSLHESRWQVVINTWKAGEADKSTP